MQGAKTDFLPPTLALNTALGLGPRMVSLPDAVAGVCKTVQAEALPVAVVAERTGDVTEWFAASMFEVVPVYRKTDTGFERVDSPRETLDRALTRLGIGPDALFVRRRDCKTYLRWARTLQ